MKTSSSDYLENHGFQLILDNILGVKALMIEANWACRVACNIRGSFKNCFLKSIKPHDLESILSTSYFYSFTLEGLYIIF